MMIKQHFGSMHEKNGVSSVLFKPNRSHGLHSH